MDELVDTNIDIRAVENAYTQELAIIKAHLLFITLTLLVLIAPWKLTGLS